MTRPFGLPVEERGGDDRGRKDHEKEQEEEEKEESLVVVSFEKLTHEHHFPKWCKESVPLWDQLLAFLIAGVTTCLGHTNMNRFCLAFQTIWIDYPANWMTDPAGE